jgi:hypothetical protein
LFLKHLLFSLIIANCFVSVAEFIALDDIHVFASKPPRTLLLQRLYPLEISF